MEGTVTMFDIEEFYLAAENGENVDEESLRSYMASFENVVLWGAGNLGTVLGKYFVDQGYPLTVYWDAKADQIGRRNGVEVKLTFSDDYDKERTLVIIGIVNGTLSHRWQVEQLHKNGYSHYIKGMHLYEALLCPMKKGDALDVKYCNQSKACNFNTCKRYINLLNKNSSSGEKKQQITIQVLEFILSRRCTLDCIHCGQEVGFIKRNFPEKYIDYPLERIKKDIDIMMDNVDAVGTFSLIGGEPFIHPQIDKIIEHCLTKDNVAIIAVTTNGVCHISEQAIERMQDKRVKVNFSDYTQTLSEKEKELFQKNVEKIRVAGINYSVGVPLWVSHTYELVENPNFSGEYLSERKKACVFGPSVSNGIVYACPVTEMYAKKEGLDVREDMIDLSEKLDFRAEIARLVRKPYHKACGHRCGNDKPGKQVIAGEQYRSEREMEE